MLQVVRPPLRQSLIRFYPNFIEALVEESYIPTMFGFLFHAAAYGGIAVGVGYLLQLFLDRTLAYGVVFSVWLLLVLLGLLAIHVAAARRWRAKWQQFRARRHQPRFNYPDDWDDLRRIVYARDGYRCMNCGASGVELHAHHIVPLSRGGTNNLTNLTTLCERCHTLLHPHMR
jgi:5-methylcytosine-specific restriction endonuclease McrA